MNAILLLDLLKIMVYPIVIYIIYRIGYLTGFWKGWLFITLGMIMPFLTVIIHLADLLIPGTDFSLITSTIPLVSNVCMGIGFYFIYIEVKDGKGHKPFNIWNWLHGIFTR